MREIIAAKVENFKRELEEIFQNDSLSLERAEAKLVAAASRCAAELLGAYYEEQDERLLQAKTVRKQEGLTVEHRGDARTVLTLLGEVSYSRTYYQKAAGGYCYPVDELAGIKPYERVSNSVGLALVGEATKGSYARCSEIVTGGAVSRQTVMQKVRIAEPRVPPVPRRRVAVLHVDADEDHVRLQTGESTIVPLLSAYEGIARRGKRGVCQNIFHYGRYGEAPDSLWEGFLDELERRYDLSDTVVYLHGDGASWIKAGMDWLPNCRFVLDRYHKNKALKKTFSGIERREARAYESVIRGALDSGDRELFSDVRESLLLQWPEQRESIAEGADYLLNNMDGIRICAEDAEALNGGATEPHVSHILSTRLSSRPMGWSGETLRHLVPILAAGDCSFSGMVIPAQQAVSASNFLSTPRPKRILPFTAGAPFPDNLIRFPAANTKTTQLSRLLRSL